MTTPTQYPSVSTLVPTERLPSSLEVVGDTIDDLLAKLRYRALVVERSPDNVTASFSLVLVTKELSVDLLGSGLKLIFFPPLNQGDPVSEIPIGFEYRWRILRYLPEFKTLSFDGTAKAFFDIFLDLVEITEEEFLEGIVGCFISDLAPYQALVDLLNQDADLAAAGLTLSNLPVGYSEVEYIVEQIRTASVDVFEVAFETVVNDLNHLDESIDKLVILFQRWLGSITRDDIQDFLLPQFSLGIKDVSMALEVPDTVLIPVDSNNVQIPNTKSRLTFTADGVRYDSRSGFEMDISSVGASLAKSMVPRLGLTLEFDDIKIDLSRTTNIAEADVEGRPVDFMGVSIGNAVIGLPAKWFAASGGGSTTLGIVGRNLLIGTGGLSGTVGLEALTAGKPNVDPTLPSTGAELSFTLGKKPPSGTGTARKGFQVGFSSFHMKFLQNRLLETDIKGSLTVPKFDPNPIGVELELDADGDFELTASVPGGHDFKWPGVFTFKAKKVSVGKDDKRVFLSTSGDLIFEPGTILGTFVKKPIHVEKLLIHSDGSIELEGGKIPLPESVVLPLGPAKISITAIHFGSHRQEHNGAMREYRYWGFDGGVSVNPGGVDASGDGIKFYYTVDDDPTASTPRLHHSFLQIAGIRVNLMIPGNASKDKAVLLLQGYLSLKDPVYQGSLQFELPQVKVAGGAYMKYDTSYPAWAVDVNLQLPKALPLGATGLGIVGFRGLFGLRYVATKDAIDTPTPLPPDASWGDYYRAPQPQKGVGIDKFKTPDKTAGASKPFSVGVGVDLITQSDDGKAFQSQLFLLVSVPNLIMLEGRADILTNHRLTQADEPPYYAYLALSPESIELGVGVNYLVSKPDGKVLNLNAVLEAAFFFHNSSAWYVNIGTKAKPATARVLDMFDAYAYLMLSASGIETGAGVQFDFKKEYGPIRVAAHAYLDMWAYLSFERRQAGGGIALGGHVDIKVFKFGLYIELAAGLTAEMPKPFRVAGYAEICVTVNLKVKKWHKCCKIEFVWDRDSSVELTPVDVMTNPANAPGAAAVAVHMVSGSTYDVAFSTTPALGSPPVIPVDSYIDVKFTKPVNPAAATMIGGYTSPAVGATEKLPPKYGSRVVTHSYALTDAKLEVLDKTTGTWKTYQPYLALAPDASLSTTTQAQLAALPIGVWQKQDDGYSQIRFLALTPFSWMGAASGFVPEEMGVTARSTYCVGRSRYPRCLTWTSSAVFTTGTDYHGEGVLYRVDGDRVAAIADPHPRKRHLLFSLAFEPMGTATFRFPEPTVTCYLTLRTTAPYVTLHWQRRVKSTSGSAGGTVVQVPWTEPQFEDAIPPQVVSSAELAESVFYSVNYYDPANPIDRVVVTTPTPNVQKITDLEAQIELKSDAWVRSSRTGRRKIAAELSKLRSELTTERAKYCQATPQPDEKDDLNTAIVDNRVPTGWECGTFVHDVCWVSEADAAYNQSIPGIAAIEADFSRMRAAIENTIAPILRPRETYRITLTVSDKVTGPDSSGNSTTNTKSTPYYVHFKTEGPLGHFPAGEIPASPVIDTVTTANSLDDGRLEVPERSLKFYLDFQKSFPDPSGKLLYAKPLYYKDVELRLFMDRPYAYHFFADWPGAAQNYALQLAIKDPAEAPPSLTAPLAHEQAFVSAPLVGNQSWVVDPAPKIDEEIKALRNFQDPLKSGTAGHGPCLAIGGDSITPLSKHLKVEIPDLEPNKLYTAVVLHNCIDLVETKEVHRYPFKTSLYPDFATHIASYKMEDDAGNQHSAVFSIDHPLPAAAEAQALTAALPIVDENPAAATVTHPDFFDRLVYGLFQLAPLPPAASVEFNFVTNSTTGHTYGLWIRSPEALFDPRLPPDPQHPEIEMLGGPTTTHVLLSRDRWQAFVMVASGAFPTQDISIRFTNRIWDGHAYVVQVATTDPFSRP